MPSPRIIGFTLCPTILFDRFATFATLIESPRLLSVSRPVVLRQGLPGSRKVPALNGLIGEPSGRVPRPSIVQRDRETSPCRLHWTLLLCTGLTVSPVSRPLVLMLASL